MTASPYTTPSVRAIVRTELVWVRMVWSVNRSIRFGGPVSLRLLITSPPTLADTTNTPTHTEGETRTRRHAPEGGDGGAVGEADEEEDDGQGDGDHGGEGVQDGAHLMVLLMLLLGFGGCLGAGKLSACVCEREEGGLVISFPSPIP